MERLLRSQRMLTPPSPSPSPLIKSYNCREIRTSLRKSKQHLDKACDGITVKVFIQKRLFFFKEIGVANIKDISLSGAGLLTPLKLAKGDKIYIEINNEKLECTIARWQIINPRLNFAGVQWTPKYHQQIKDALWFQRRIGKMETDNIHNKASQSHA